MNVVPLPQLPPSEPELDPLLEPLLDPLLEPLLDPLLEPLPEPLPEPLLEPLLDPEPEPLLDPLPELLPDASPISPASVPLVVLEEHPSSISGTMSNTRRATTGGRTLARMVVPVNGAPSKGVQATYVYAECSRRPAYPLLRARGASSATDSPA